MNISAEFAQKIVNEMKEIINHDLNFMESSGNIIASTDPKRKGTFHEGAKLVAKNGNDLIIYKDGQYIGARKGINMPVYFEGNIIGVIGITGDYREVEKYGKIIRKMTEILIKEAYLKNLNIREIEKHRALVEDLLFGDKYLNNPKLQDQINLFKINITGPMVVVISRETYHPNLNDEIRDYIFNEIYFRKITRSPNNLIMQSRNHNIMILRFISRDNLKSLLMDIYCEIKKKYQIEAKFGVGIVVNDINDLKFSYKKSRIALDATKYLDNQWIVFYEDMDLELVLNPLPKDISKEFVDKIFSYLTSKELKEFEMLFKSYEKNNGSISKIAEDLYMHKNSVQYKLNKYAKKLGYDMRKYRDFSILKIALILNNSIN